MMHLLNLLEWFTLQHHNSPIIIGGYFNMFTPRRKKGGMKILSTEDYAFKATIANCALVDL